MVPATDYALVPGNWMLPYMTMGDPAQEVIKLRFLRSRGWPALSRQPRLIRGIIIRGRREGQTQL